MKPTLLSILALLVFGQIFSQLPAFDSQAPSAAPDYARPDMWAALPFRKDAADEIPRHETWVDDSLKEVDVFYIHPTIYAKGETWNADLADQKLNDKVDRLPVRFQASPFNRTGRVYAPRYRQAILQVFHQPSADGDKALDLAYGDVKKAFEYYLEHDNKGRPFIIASHSQGSLHARRLLSEFIDGKPLAKQFVAGYIVGFSVNESRYKAITLCRDSTQTGCYVSWLSYRWGYRPKGNFYKDAMVVNPLTWTTTTAKIHRKQGVGGILLNPRREFKHANTVQVEGEYIWVKTRIPFFPFLKTMHVIDYNLFWYDIRQNVQERFDAYKLNRGR